MARTYTCARHYLAPPLTSAVLAARYAHARLPLYRTLWFFLRASRCTTAVPFIASASPFYAAACAIDGEASLFAYYLFFLCLLAWRSGIMLIVRMLFLLKIIGLLFLPLALFPLALCSF